MIGGIYTLVLFCDVQGCQHGRHGMNIARAEFTGETGSDCRMAAREAGWALNLEKKRAECPKCCAKRVASPVASGKPLKGKTS